MVVDVDAGSAELLNLKARYECPQFRILVIGRANAGKTTILEKVCSVAKGTKPFIYDEHGVELEANFKLNPEPKPKPRLKLFAPIQQLLDRKLVLLPTHLTPSVEVSFVHMYLYPLISK